MTATQIVREAENLTNVAPYADKIVFHESIEAEYIEDGGN